VCQRHQKELFLSGGFLCQYWQVFYDIDDLVIKYDSYFIYFCENKYHTFNKQNTMNTIKPKTLDELKKLRKPLRNINIIRKQKLSKLDKLAVWITEHVGTMGFFILIFVWTVSWLGWNMFAPVAMRFDPYPAFVLWLFMSNMIQIFLMPLIMIGQNLQSAHSEARAEADFDVNTKAELEIETILTHLEYQNELMLEILKRLEKDNEKK